jgi:hypothetical protein
MSNIIPEWFVLCFEGVAKISDSVKLQEALEEVIGDEELTPISGGSYLAKGSFGCAVGLGRDKVIKITSDPTEVEAALGIVGEDIPNVVNVYYATKVKGVKAKPRSVPAPLVSPGIIVSERLTPAIKILGQRQISILRAIADMSKIKFGLFSPNTFFLPKRKRLELFRATYEFVLNELLEAFETYTGDTQVFEDVINGMESLERLGIYVFDIHPGNIGWKDPAFKILDLCFSASTRNLKETGGTARRNPYTDEDGVTYYTAEDLKKFLKERFRN